MKTLDTTARLFSRDEAERVAAEMTAADEDGWTYTADHDPAGTGYSRVEVTDEDGEFVAFVA